MVSDVDITKALKLTSTVAMGYMFGATACKSITVLPGIFEQENVGAAAKTMGGILRHSSSMPQVSMLAAAAQVGLYWQSYGSDNEDKFYLISGVLMFAMTPYTKRVLIPINKQLCDRENKENFDENDERWSGLLKEWYRLHNPRTVLCAGLFAAGVYKLIF